MLDQLKKKGLFGNLKKYYFHKDKVCFLGYVILVQKIQIEDKKIDMVKNWPKPKSMQNIQFFLGFANFYQWFIQDFCKIAGLLTLMLRMSLIIWSAKNLLSNLAEYIEIDNGDGDQNKIIERLLQASNSNKKTDYLNSNAKKCFTQLRQLFTQVPIFECSDSEQYIWI